jgi:esterase
MELYSKIEGSGKPLLILHGFLGMSDNWKTLGSQWATLGFEVHLLDMRNHGRSFHSSEFNYDVMVEDVAQYCSNKNLSSIALLGHSMGGKVAMFFAAKYPKIVHKLIIADIGPKYYKPHHQDILAGLNAVQFESQPDRSEVEEQLKTHIPDFGTRQFLMKSLYWKQPGQLAFRFNLKVFNEQIEQIGKALNPTDIYEGATLFIRGGASRYVLDSDFELIRSHFPQVVFETIPNAGHWLHAENPTLFYEKVSLFLNT